MEKKGTAVMGLTYDFDWTEETMSLRCFKTLANVSLGGISEHKRGQWFILNKNEAGGRYKTGAKLWPQ